jgi:hypothetical protein
MNVLSLFDGISCGQQALHNLGIKVDNYYACEVDEKSIQVTQHNFPNTIQLGDVTKLKASDLPKIDLVMGGSPCFVAGTKVYTDNGYVNIEDIKVGDKVLTHTLEYHEVVRVGGETKEIVEIVPQDGRDVVTSTTLNHPYYSRHMTPNGWSEPEWIEVGDLNPNYDMVAFPNQLIDGEDNIDYVYESNDITWVAIKSIKPTSRTERVYNIEVDTDNSYTANNIIVHNCQGFSLSGKQLAFDDPRSALFFEFHRIVQEVKPKYFFLENNRMKKEYLDVIDEHMGVKSIQINSALVSAQNRIRHYWTNIPNVTMPENKNIMLKDIIGEYEGIWVYPRGFNKGGVQSYKGKCPTITTSSWEHNFKVALPSGETRKFTPEECEVIQGLPIGYTSCISNAQRYKKIGNGWTVQVIEHLFTNIRNANE